MGFYFKIVNKYIKNIKVPDKANKKEKKNTFYEVFSHNFSSFHYSLLLSFLPVKKRKKRDKICIEILTCWW